MMKITFISLSPHAMRINAVGVRILSALLKREGCDVEIIFLPRVNAGDIYDQSVLDQVLELSISSDLIGISLMTDDFDNVAQITKTLKSKLDTPVIWGGIHPTIQPESCLEYADIVCIGEGEESLVTLVKKLNQGEDYYDIDGLWFKTKDQIIRNEVRPLIRNLDRLPFQDYDFDNHYILIDGQIRKIDNHIMQACLGDYYLTLTSRGCPFKCTYCWNHTFNRMFNNKNVFRKRSVDNVIEELRRIRNKYPFLKMIHIDDDAFFMRPEDELRYFSKKYKEQIGIPMWITGVTPNIVTRKRLTMLIDAGMVSLRMGIQTASDRIRKMYRRKNTNQQVKKAVLLLNEFKDTLKVQYDIILDNPWESEADKIKTLMFLSTLPVPYELFFFPLKLYPETDLYKKALNEKDELPVLEEMIGDSHHAVRETYLNGLFLLLNEYAKQGKRIPPFMMFVLTSKVFRSLGISGFAYTILNRMIQTEFICRFKYLLSEGWKDVLRGDLKRILSYLKRIR